MSTPVIQVEGLSRHFRRDVRALDDVTIDIRRDVITGLLGRNGAGKTTLMSVLTGQDFPTAGSVRVFGQNPLENESVLSQLCFIRESQRYPNNFKLRHLIAAGRAFYPNWDDDIARALVEQFNLPSKREVNKMSRGMRSSVGILVGLASRAPITIFDEPYLGLDASARQQFYDMLLADYAENPRTVILSTHLIDEVATMLEDVVVLDRGRVAMAGSADDLARRGCTLTGPADAVKALAAGRPVLHRHGVGGHLSLTVDIEYSPDLRERAQATGVDATPISLQTLVVRASACDRPTVGASS